VDTEVGTTLPIGNSFAERQANPAFNCCI